MLYPLMFRPILKEHIWGGRRLAEMFGKPLPPGAQVGESWEISDRPEGVSVVANGPLAGRDLRWLMEQHGPEVLGSALPLGGRFPLLVKILDCREAPSVQVHPPPEQCERLGGEPKTEVWYVVGAGADAHLLAGLRAGVKRQQFERRIGDGTVFECLHRVAVRVGDAMFVPSGRVHSIGGGNVVFEIQQNSNTTYRVFDWNRRGPDGQPRTLHVEQSMAAIDFEDFEPGLVGASFAVRDGGEVRRLVEGALFEVEEWRTPAGHARPAGGMDRPWVLGVVSGRVCIRHAASGTLGDLEAGGFCLIPAAAADAVIETPVPARYLLAAPGVAGPVAEPAERVRVVEGLTADAPESARGAVPAWATYVGPPRKTADAEPRTILPSRRRLKKELTKRLTYWPFLKVLILDFWFRSAVLTLVGLGLVAGVLLPRVWRSTPRGFLPVVRVSLLDRIQARMLRRTAEKAAAAGRWDAAWGAWRQALANNRGNAQLARGLVECTQRMDAPSTDQLRGGIQTVEWLLRLTQTNRSDLEVCVRCLDRWGQSELVLDSLASFGDQIPATLAVAQVRALFLSAKLAEFDRRWEKLTAAQREDPEIRLLRAAYLAAWAPSRATGGELQELQRAARETKGEMAAMPNRLLLAVSVSRVDTPGYSEALQRLVELHEDTAGDHALYWRLLAGTGRKEEALRLAKEYAFPPRSAGDLVRLTESYRLLGLTDEAMKGLERYAPTVGYTEEVWIIYAGLLLDTGDWEKLRSVALLIRQMPRFRRTLEGLSHYYEGRADLATGRTNAAANAFERASGAAFPDFNRAMATANGLRTNGYAQHALRVVDGLLAVHETNRIRVLAFKFELGMALQDESVVVAAARAAYEIAPHDAVQANRYAAAVLIEGKNPAEALRITRDLREQFPNSKSALLNHAYALLMNRRPDEAAALLNRLDPRLFSYAQVNSYYQSMFELNRQRGAHDAAWDAYDHINTTELFPIERARLKAAVETLPPRKPAAGS